MPRRPRSISTRDIRLTLLEAAPRILPPLSERCGAATELPTPGRRGARQRAGDGSAEGVTTQSGAFDPADLVVWAAGIKALDCSLRSTAWRSIATTSSSSRPCNQRAIRTSVLGDCAAALASGARGRRGVHAPAAPAATLFGKTIAPLRWQAAADFRFQRRRLLVSQSVRCRQPDGETDRRQPADP
jgi:NADH dehydrogenase